jgi:TadE-like protein
MMPSRIRRGSGKSRSGQGMVEFALLVPVLMLMLLGLADVARAVYTYNIISNSAREGTREAILAYNQCHNAGAPCSTPPAGSTVIGVDNAIKRAGAGVVSYVFNDTATDTGTPPQPLCTPLPNQGCVWIFIVNDDILSAQTCVNLGPSDTFAGAPCDFNASKEGGSRNVVVEIEYNFSPFTPLVAKALGSSTVMWAKSEMRTEY